MMLKDLRREYRRAVELRQEALKTIDALIAERDAALAEVARLKLALEGEKTEYVLAQINGDLRRINALLEAEVLEGRAKLERAEAVCEAQVAFDESRAHEMDFDTGIHNEHCGKCAAWKVRAKALAAWREGKK